MDQFLNSVAGGLFLTVFREAVAMAGVAGIGIFNGHGCC